MSTVTFDLSTPQGREELERMDPGVIEFLHDGYSLAQAFRLNLGRLYGFFVDIPNKGPRVPGYAEGVQNAPGGWAMVGERGPEPMYVPKGASIFPTGTGFGGGATYNITNHLYVNGTIQDLARPLMDEITRMMKQSRQWPSA